MVSVTICCRCCAWVLQKNTYKKLLSGSVAKPFFFVLPSCSRFGEAGKRGKSEFSLPLAPGKEPKR